MDLDYVSSDKIVTAAVQVERAKMIEAIRIAANMMFVVDAKKGNTVLKKDFADRLKSLVIYDLGYSIEIRIARIAIHNA